MKKIFIALAVLFIMSGCGEKTDSLSCNNTSTTNGLITKTSYDIDYVNDEVKYVTITYDYSQDINSNNNDDVDGINADTDGLDTNNDTDNNDGNIEANDVVDGVVGDAIDGTVEGVRDTILGIAGIKNNYENQMSTYDNIKGFSYNVDVDNDNEYKVVYKIDMNEISDTDLARFNVSRNFSDFRTTYEDLGYTCR